MHDVLLQFNSAQEEKLIQILGIQIFDIQVFALGRKASYHLLDYASKEDNYLRTYGQFVHTSVIYTYIHT